jgi:hypothetical protein
MPYKLLRQTTEASSTNHAQTGQLMHGINDKLQQHITASAETAYSNVASRSKKAAGDDDEDSQPGPTMVAVEALKTLFSASMTDIRQVGLSCFPLRLCDILLTHKIHRPSNGSSMISLH